MFLVCLFVSNKVMPQLQRPTIRCNIIFTIVNYNNDNVEDADDKWPKSSLKQTQFLVHKDTKTFHFIINRFLYFYCKCKAKRIQCSTRVNTCHTFLLFRSSWNWSCWYRFWSWSQRPAWRQTSQPLLLCYIYNVFTIGDTGSSVVL